MVKSTTKKRAAFFLLLLTVLNAIYLVHQNQKIIALFDFSYFTDLATRINLGQTPYTDFPIASNPGSFYSLAVLLRIFPENYNAILLYMAIQNTLIIFAVYWISNQFIADTKRRFLISLMFFVPTLNIYSIFHQPFYDADAIFAVVVSIFLLTKIEKNFSQNRKNNALILISTGVSIFAPFVYKQNIGIPWLFFWLCVGFYVIVSESKKRKDVFKIFLGIFLSFAIFSTWIIKNGLTEKWIYWTIERPLQIRNSSIYILIEGLKSFEKIGILIILTLVILRIVTKKKQEDYNHLSVLIVIPCMLILFKIAFDSSTFILKKISVQGTIHYPLIISSILAFLTLIVFSSTKLNYRKILILSIVLVCIPTMLPQGFYGSSQSIWPLLILALILALSEPLVFINKTIQKFIFASLVFLLLIVSTMSLYLVRYDWLPLESKPSAGSASFGLLKTYGNYLQESETMANLFLKYKELGKIAVFPGEEPIAFLTGQVPDVEVSSSDPTTNPWYPNLKGWLETKSIDYLIYRENGQNISSSEINFKIISTLQNQFKVVEKIGNYVVYKKIT